MSHSLAADLAWNLAIDFDWPGGYPAGRRSSYENLPELVARRDVRLLLAQCLSGSLLQIVYYRLKSTERRDTCNRTKC